MSITAEARASRRTSATPRPKSRPKPRQKAPTHRVPIGLKLAARALDDNTAVGEIVTRRLTCWRLMTAVNGGVR
jgi:hypothetical protein